MAKTILIVEDEQVLRESLAELLRSESPTDATEGAATESSDRKPAAHADAGAGECYEVLEARHGKAAVEILLAHSVDLILTDIRMPEMDGMTLISHVAKIAPQTPVIVLDGVRDRGIRGRGDAARGRRITCSSPWISTTCW